MPASDCSRKNPLVRGGTNQAERYTAALSPAYFRLDERSPADLILFAERFSRHLVYFDAGNAPAGNWHPFFTADISAILAGLSKLPVAAFRQFSRALQDTLAGDPDRGTAELASHFQLFFHLPVLLLGEIGQHFDRLPPEHALRPFLQTLLLRDAAGPLADLLRYYAGAVAVVPQVFDDVALVAASYNLDFDDADPRIQLPSAVTSRLAFGKKLSELAVSGPMIAGFAPAGWAAFAVAQAADPYTAPYEDAAALPDPMYQQIYDALHYNLLAKAVERLFQVTERVAQEAATYLDASLTADDTHTPHYGLWLAFLRLFALNQAHLNELTGRHLEYYYREVLGLCALPARPDQVHLLVELSKGVPEHLLPATTTYFRAGKDPAGKELLYRLDADFVANRAAVVALQSVYRPPALQEGMAALGLFASPVTNSEDGQGKPLPKDAPHWPPFGRATGSPNARAGFAVADGQLMLAEGARTIRITVTLATAITKPRALSGGKVALTGEKGWLSYGVSIALAGMFPTKSLEFTVELSGDAPPVTPYDPAVHGETFGVTTPLLKFEVDWSQSGALALYDFLAQHAWTALKVTTEASGVRSVTLDNDTGTLDPARPFQPFGASPSGSASLIIGNSEVFGKPLDELTLDLDWETPYNGTDFFLKKAYSLYTVRVYQLRGGAWQEVDTAKGAPPGTKPPKGGDVIDVRDTFRSRGEAESDADTLIRIAREKTARTGFKETFTRGAEEASRTSEASRVVQGAYPPKLFTLDGASTSITLTKNLPGSGAPALQNPPYSPGAREGFLKLVLNQGFGHAEHPDHKTRILIDLARGGTLTKSSSYNYNASTDLPLAPYTPVVTALSLTYCTEATTPAHFFHLHPFGHTEPGPGALAPPMESEGELYIGVKDLQPPQRLALLFRVLDGSANPLKTPATLQWDYLRDNEWVPLADHEVDDKTNSLAGTGIAGIAVPEDANTEHTLLAGGLLWIRMAAPRDADALNHITSVDAQAVTATFFDQGNDPSFLAEPLPPGTISKLKTGVPSVKKIVQPGPSFGGAPPEEAGRFHVRASERLRHKDRGITLWDYEHLVLEHFPNIYRVKCINHTELLRDANGDIIADNEVRPGSVVLVTIPDLRAVVSYSDPLRPYTDKRTLVAIDALLRERLSPFVRLEVQNPRLEEVQLKFKVAFTEEIADIDFYKLELNAAIIRYLCPWAWDESASGADISFGGKWHKSSIIDFIEEQSYVDYIEDFEMYHKPDISKPDAAWSRVDEEVVEASTARSILVSHRQHVIDGLS
jgi:hypothetical protein